MLQIRKIIGVELTTSKDYYVTIPGIEVLSDEEEHKSMYKGVIDGWIKHLDFMILDVFCLEISFLIAYILRNYAIEDRIAIPEIYRTLAVMIAVIDVCVAFFGNSYSDIIYRGRLEELKKVMLHCAGVVLGVITWMFLTKQSDSYSRLIILIMYPISICLMIVERLVWKKFLRIKIRKNKDTRRIMVITTADRVTEVLDGLSASYRDYKVEVAALYDNLGTSGDEIYGVPVITGHTKIVQYVRENVVDEVFIDLDKHEESVEKLTNLLVSMGFVVHVNLTKYGSAMENKKVNSFGKYVVLSSGMKFASPWQIIAKRVMDICGGIVGMAITGIAALIFAPVIRHQSPGPIFFTQDRIGRNGRVFKIYKFRTMYPDAEERKKELMDQNKMKGFMFKMDDDPRIIPIGHFLRKHSIDELPQFWNVLKGDMSLVGTRPPTVEEYQQYGIHHRKRLAMKPGLTGMWQISGRSDITDFDEVVALDAKYIKEWNIGLDIKIICKTIKKVIVGDGAV